jgi:HAD superfamily hydrolase (TIGR01484 family)
MKITFSTVNFTSRDISQARRLVKYPITTVFSDIDGTIADACQIVPQEHLFAIKKLEEANIPLILSTGRGYKAVDALFEKFQMKPEIVITESGAVVVDGAKK